MLQFTFNNGKIAELFAPGTSEWAVVGGGLVALQVQLLGGATAANVQFELAVEGPGGVLALASELTPELTSDGITFPVETQNFPKVRMTVTSLTGEGSVRADAVFKELRQCESSITRQSACGKRTSVGPRGLVPA